MSTAVINIKTDPKVKKKAQAVAEELGFSLSAVLNAYLRNLIRTRKVEFSDDVHLELTPWAKRMLRESEKDVKAGRVSPGFTNAKDAIAWLNDPNSRYQNGDPV
ncbi:type II toxin-antitoxin system RelB/DinJ family antitoxin [Candidatus Gottesmanbacteria bacterium]|nr:type II toxin-antitoxin system RelB/DinJ family antitoxin [Candidatus Gottesmanbacteria bacterium]